MSDSAGQLAKTLHANLEKLITRIRRNNVVVRLRARPHDTQHLADKLGFETLSIVHVHQYMRRHGCVHQRPGIWDLSSL